MNERQALSVFRAIADIVEEQTGTKIEISIENTSQKQCDTSLQRPPEEV